MKEHRPSTTRKKFDEEPGSVDATLSKLPYKLRSKYRKNKAKLDADRLAMERWASDGYTSGSDEG
jgi:hypothetical protein